MVDKKAQGKKNRRKGQTFETKVRKHLESKGWIVNKHHNQIDINTGFYPARPAFIRGRPISLGTGFPDFLCYMTVHNVRKHLAANYKIMYVEAKKGKYLDREEREKCSWLLQQGYSVWVAYEKDGEIQMLNYENYGKR